MHHGCVCVCVCVCVHVCYMDPRNESSFLLATIVVFIVQVTKYIGGHIFISSSKHRAKEAKLMHHGLLD